MEYIIEYSGIFGALLALIALFFIIGLFLKVKRTQHVIETEALNNKKQLDRLQKIQKQQEEMLNELQMATRGISDKVISLQNVQLPDVVDPDDFQELKEQVIDAVSKMHSIESADPASKLYTKASKLVASGATIEEIMDECELPRAEAELMMSLHARN